jgi:hypothetical protein
MMGIVWYVYAVLTDHSLYVRGTCNVTLHVLYNVCLVYFVPI